MKRTALAVGLVTLGFLLSPRPTIAQKQEDLELLCQRFQKNAGHLLTRYDRMATVGTIEEKRRTEAPALTLRALRDIFCAPTR